MMMLNKVFLKRLTNTYIESDLDDILSVTVRKFAFTWIFRVMLLIGGVVIVNYLYLIIVY